MNETLNCELLQATGECGYTKVTKNVGARLLGIKRQIKQTLLVVHRSQSV